MTVVLAIDMDVVGYAGVISKWALDHDCPLTWVGFPTAIPTLNPGGSIEADIMAMLGWDTVTQALIEIPAKREVEFRLCLGEAITERHPYWDSHPA